MTQANQAYHNQEYKCDLKVSHIVRISVNYKGLRWIGRIAVDYGEDYSEDLSSRAERGDPESWQIYVDFTVIYNLDKLTYYDNTNYFANTYRGRYAKAVELENSTFHEFAKWDAFEYNQ